MQFARWIGKHRQAVVFGFGFVCFDVEQAGVIPQFLCGRFDCRRLVDFLHGVVRSESVKQSKKYNSVRGLGDGYWAEYRHGNAGQKKPPTPREKAAGGQFIAGKTSYSLQSPTSEQRGDVSHLTLHCINCG